MCGGSGVVPPAPELSDPRLTSTSRDFRERRFTLGSATDRKIVVIEVNGTNLTVLRVKPDGTTKRQSQSLLTEAAARSASEQLARELISRGYAEQAASGTRASKPRVKVAMAGSPVNVDEDDNGLPYDLFEEAAETPQPVLQRLATAPAPSAEPRAETPPRKKKGKKKKRKKAEADGLDKRVLAGVAAVGL